MSIETHELSHREAEALALVCQLNNELYERFGDSQIGEVPQFVYHINECDQSIAWGEIPVWNAENYPQYDDDDNEIPIENTVRENMKIIAAAATWIAGLTGYSCLYSTHDIRGTCQTKH